MMHARAAALITGTVGAFVLNATTALGQIPAADLQPSPDEPQVLVPRSEPVPKPKPRGTDSDRTTVEPVFPLAGATPQPLATEEPTRATAATKMIHERRWGLIVAGYVVTSTTYVFQLFIAAEVAATANYTCNYCSKQAALLLIPIAGPWLGGRVSDYSVWWSVPGDGTRQAYLIWSGLEAAGAAMLIVGAVGHDVPQDPSAQRRSLTFMPFATPRTEGFLVSMRW